MAKKKTKKQVDLFGNPVKENSFKNQVKLIGDKIDDSEGFLNGEFNHDYWEKKADKFRKMGKREKELEVYNKFIRRSGFTSPYELSKGTLLVDMGRFDEALKTLKNLYGCESHDTIVAPAQLQMARVSAIKGEKDDMIEYLKKAIHTIIFFNFSSGHYSKEELIKDIYNTSEFDNYRDTKELKDFLTYNWEREDEIELDAKIKHYLTEKHITLELIDPIRLRLIEYLCKYVESDVYLDFDLGPNWLVNSSKSILIVDNYSLKYRGLGAHYANFVFSQNKLDSISHIGRSGSDNTYLTKDIIYNRVDVELALKIVKTSVDVYIFEKPNALVITFAVGSSSYVQVGDEYRSGSRRINEDYSVIIFPSSSNNEEFLKFLASYGSQAFSDILKVIKKNYPENLTEESLKKSLDIDRYQDIDPLRGSFKILFEKIKNEIGETEDKFRKFKTLLEYAQTYIFYLSKEDSFIFSDFIDEVITYVLKQSNIEDIQAIFDFPYNLLHDLLKSASLNYYGASYVRMSSYFELIKDKIDVIDNEFRKLKVLDYFDKYSGIFSY